MIQKLFAGRRKWFLIAIIIFLILVGSNEEKQSGKTLDTGNDTATPAIPVVQKNDAPVAERGSRLLGIALSEGGVGYENTFAEGLEAGLNVIEFPLSWNDVEYENGKYKDDYLSVANGFFPENNIKVSLGLNPIDTNNVRLPNDLKGKSFDDPEVIARFIQYVDFVASKIPDITVITVSLGNEIDSTLNDDKGKWEEYTRFYNAVSPHVREKFPSAVVSSKVTFGGVRDHTELVKQYVNNTDAVFLTYYPFKKDTFVVQGQGALTADLTSVLNHFPKKKLYLSEVGCPAGKLNDSSEDIQALFVHEVFQFWDAHLGQIPYANFVWMHDLAPSEVAKYEKYYGVSDKGFTSFLGTLGLQTYDGKPRKAFEVLKDETKQRNW